MTDTLFHIEVADWDTRQGQIKEVRTRVFIREQGVPEELEWDEKDRESIHLLALLDSGEAIGTARMFHNHIGRMCVLPDWRGKGVGRRLLATLLDLTRQHGMEAPILHAQTSAIGFYEKSGFIASGPLFMDAGIAHRTMTYLGRE